MRGRVAFVALTLVVAGVAVAQSIRPNGGGGGGSSTPSLPLDAQDVYQELIEYAPGFGMYEDATIALSDFDAYLFPGGMSVRTDVATGSSSISAYAVPDLVTPGSAFSDSSLYAYGASATGTYGGRDLAGGAQLWLKGDDSAAWSHITLDRGVGISVNQSTTEFMSITPAAGVVLNEDGLSALDFRVESDTDSDFLSVDASANTGLFGPMEISASLIDANTTLQAQGTTAINIVDTGGTTRGEMITRNGNAELYIQEGGGGGAIKLTSGGMVIGQTGSASALSGLVSFASLISTGAGTTGTPVFTVYGGGGVVHGPGTARTITSPTDTTTDPVVGGTACRMSSSGAAAWTPSESSGVTGTIICCTNTGTNDITMTDSDGVYEGPGSVVGQWDQVCFEYVTDRWVERSFSNNEP